MPASSREPGRALLYVVLAVVVAAVVGLIVVADPFGTGDAIERGDVAEETGDLRTEGDGRRSGRRGATSRPVAWPAATVRATSGPSACAC